MKQFRFDLNSPANPLHKHWEFCVGSCHAATALRKNYQEQLEQCQREIGFRYIRFHGLFDDDMSVVTRHGPKLELSFTNIDGIFDFLLSINMKPFIELGFMPEALKSGETTVFHYKANTSPPASQEKWAWLIERFVVHLLERYGRAEVRQWFFEVWNEPNLGGPDVEEGFWGGSMEEYFTLYQTTATALKRIDPFLKVGGPASSNNAWIPEMIAFCASTDAPIDFISTHHYPTDVVFGYGAEPIEGLEPPVDWGDPNAVAEFFQDPDAEEKLKAHRALIWKAVDRGVVTQMTKKAVAEAQGLPVYYTEWNSLAGIPSDGPFGASFIAKSVLDGVDLVAGYSYWTFTDIFEEGGMPSAEFHGGFGLLTLHGIPKASYRAFTMLHSLGDIMYEQIGREGSVDIYAFKHNAAGCVQFMCVNHDSLAHEIKRESISISVVGFKTQYIDAQITMLDEENGNAFAAWEKMGSPEYPTRAQLAILHSASELKAMPLETTVTAQEIKFDLEINPMGMALVTLYFA